MQALPKEFVEIQGLWSEILSSLERVDSDEAKDLIGTYTGRLSAGRFGFDPILEAVAPTQLDRLGNILRGPIYTCDGYEWPTESGYPMVPFIQLDLEYCGRISSIDMGTGLLQAFMGHEKFLAMDALIRVVPRSKVGVESILPVPDFFDDIVAFSDISWATKDYDADDEDCQALQIVGFAPPNFGIPKLEKLRDVSDMALLKSWGLSDSQIRAFDSLAVSLTAKFEPTPFHLFGTFSPIQYGPSEVPEVLFCFGSERFGFNFGDGNAQIFYHRRDSGEMLFSFDWSCY